MKDDFMAFWALCGDIKTEMVEYKICFLTSALSHFGIYFGHVVDDTGEDWSGCSDRAGSVPVANAFVLCKYCHKSYISKNHIL